MAREGASIYRPNGIMRLGQVFPFLEIFLDITTLSNFSLLPILEYFMMYISFMYGGEVSRRLPFFLSTLPSRQNSF
jgi:hypothetical protein